MLPGARQAETRPLVQRQSVERLAVQCDGAGVGWKILGDKIHAANGSLAVQLSDNANQYVIADAVRKLGYPGFGSGGALADPPGFPVSASSTATPSVRAAARTATSDDLPLRNFRAH